MERAQNVISCNMMSYKQYRDGAFAHLSSIGIKHVEISAPEPSKVDEVRKELERHDLRVSAVSFGLDLSCEVDEQIRPRIEVAEALDCRLLWVSAHAGELPKEKAYEKLRRAGDLAGEAGMTIVLETHPDLAHNADVALETLTKVDHPHVRLNFDTGNIYYYNQGRNAVDELKKVAHLVRSVHLKDTNGKYRTTCFPALGEGVVDFAEVFRILNGVGFFGPFTLEIEGVEGEELTREEVYQRVEKSLEHLKSLGVI